tara:strand:- start:1151 stop:1324 length:174 start_codon:yes stop_codon:yes gene_type:complete
MKYKVNDIVNVHNYNYRLIGKIIKIYKDKYNIEIAIIKDTKNKLYEICLSDISMKLN